MSVWDDLPVLEESLTNIYIENLEQGMGLIGQLLRENNDQTELTVEFDRFIKLIADNFLPFAREMNYPQNADVYDQLLSFQKKLEEYISFPELFPKKIIAVGGGFSAGKSKLINTMIGEELLPTDTTPTTSIPTYIMRGLETAYYAHNIYGLKTVLNEEAIKAITHAFSDRYKLSLAQIIRNILLKSTSMSYEHFAILDTPGYTKSDHHKKEVNKDEHMARVHLQSADCLIWVVDIEKGTIPNQDFEFIKSMEVDCPIFFVFNKADKKEISDIKMIIEVARENILKQGLKCVGVGGVSALLQKEYGEDQLVEFLKTENKSGKKIDLKNECEKIFTRYGHYFEEVLVKLRNELKQLNEVVLQSSVDQEQDLLRPIIAAKKKEISLTRDKIEQMNRFLHPYYESLEKIQQLLSQSTNLVTQTFSGSNVKLQFLHRVLKVNIHQLIDEKLQIFVKDISFERLQTGENRGVIPANEIIDTCVMAFSLLETDVKLRLEKVIVNHVESINLYIDELHASPWQKEEIQHEIEALVQQVYQPFKDYDLSKEMRLTFFKVIQEYETIDSKIEPLVRAVIHQEALLLGHHLKEKWTNLFEETTSYMINLEWG